MIPPFYLYTGNIAQERRMLFVDIAIKMWYNSTIQSAARKHDCD